MYYTRNSGYFFLRQSQQVPLPYLLHASISSAALSSQLTIVIVKSSLLYWLPTLEVGSLLPLRVLPASHSAFPVLELALVISLVIGTILSLQIRLFCSRALLTSLTHRPTPIVLNGGIFVSLQVFLRSIFQRFLLLYCNPRDPASSPTRVPFRPYTDYGHPLPLYAGEPFFFFNPLALPVSCHHFFLAPLP